MTTTIPPALALQIEGCWDLAPQYRIILRRTKHGMDACQRTRNRLGAPVKRTSAVRYNPHDNTLNFTGIGSIHRVMVVLRVSDTGVESAFSTEISAGRWMHGTWESASRCTATTLDVPPTPSTS